MENILLYQINILYYYISIQHTPEINTNVYNISNDTFYISNTNVDSNINVKYYTNIKKKEKKTTNSK